MGDRNASSCGTTISARLGNDGLFLQPNKQVKICQICSFIVYIVHSLSSSLYSSTNPPCHGAALWNCSCLHWATPRTGLRLHEWGKVSTSLPTSAPQHPSNFWWGYIPWLLTHSHCLEPNNPSALPFTLQNPLIILQYQRHNLGISLMQRNPWRLTTLGAQGYDKHDKKRSLHPL